MTVIHVCIATGQNAANFIPLKQYGAQEVWILETPAMKAQKSGDDLKAALAPYVASVRCLNFDDKNPETITASAAKLANDSLDGKDVIFHITGGTKLMVLAIHQELALLGSGTGSYKAIYADTQNQTIDWMDAKPSQESMQDVLSLQDLLLLRGYRTTSDTRPAKDQQRAADRAKVSRHMGDHAQELGKFFSNLAYRANLAVDGGSLSQEFDYPPGGPAAKLLKLSVSNKLLEWTEGRTEVTFADRDCARFFAGGWTEEFVFLKMTGLLKAGQYALNVKVRQSRTATDNEIDAIAVKNNRALLVECKSGKQDKAQESIYKLSQVVRQVGGLMAKGLYVSAQNLTEADLVRAKEYGIEVLAAENLSRVSEYLRNWAKTA